MSKGKKRTRITASSNAAIKITVRPHQYEKRGVYYHTHLVQGWKEDGKWKKKEFKDIKDAERFAALKRVELENRGRKLHLQSTSLDETQIREAEDAINNLGEAYTLRQAVDYFLSNHRPPSHTVSLEDALKLYLEDCERSGTRERTIKQKYSTLMAVSKELDNPLVHEVTPAKIQQFLRGLRAKGGMTPATRKTWNNYRNDINHFFKWTSESDLATNRPYTFTNPAESISTFTAKQVAEQRRPIAITEPKKLQRRLTALMSWKDGALIKYYALAYFAGIRPDGELTKLAKRENELINIKTRTIHIPANVSKTKEARQVHICDNLLEWLNAYTENPILPVNHSRLIKRSRQAFKLDHDETRHSFISYHVALNRSVGDVALQAGNSEGMVKKHYLNLRPAEEGEAFFRITPDMKAEKAIQAKPDTSPKESQFKAI